MDTLASMPITPEPSARDMDSQLAELLQELSQVQGELLEVLTEKRQYILRGDAKAMSGLAEKETGIMNRLEACHRRRGHLLSEAKTSGHSAASLTDLARQISKPSPGEKKSRSEEALRAAGQNFRKLQSESLSNWVLAQRSLLHVSQLLEIIATGGRIQPTYEKDAPTHARGNLVDSEA